MFSRLAADDVFISYARADASAYADGLADALVRRGFAVFIDRLGTEANSDIPRTLVAKLHRAQMLVLVGSPAAAASGFVGQEVRQFTQVRGSDRVVPIDFDNALSRSAWYDAVVGIAPEPESLAALAGGEPAPRVVARVEKAYRYTRAKDRLRRATLGALAVLGVLLAAIVGSGWYASAKIDEAAQAGRAATAAVERAVLADSAASAAALKASDAQGRAQAAIERAGQLDAAASAAGQRAAQALSRADAQERIALSRQLALVSSEALSAAMPASSLDPPGPHPDRAALWAAEAWRAAPTREAREALHAALSFEPRVVAWLPGDMHSPPPFVGDGGQVFKSPVGAVDADGTRLLQRDGAGVTLTHVASGQRAVIDPPGSLSIQAVLAPDGRVLTVHRDRANPQHWVVTRWVVDGNTARAERSGEIDLPDGQVEALAPDGRRVAVARANAVEVFDLQSGASVRVADWTRSRTGFVHERFAFMRGGSWLAFDEHTADDRRRVRVVEVGREAPVGEPVVGKLVSASPGGRLLLVDRGNRDRARLVAVELPAGGSAGLPLRVAGHDADDVRIAPDGRWLTLRSGLRSALIDLQRTQALGQRLPAGLAGWSLGWPALGLLAAAGPEGLQVWRIDAAGSATPVVRRPEVRSFALTRAGVALSIAGGTLSWVRDLTSEAPRPQTPVLDSYGQPIAAALDGARVMVAGRRGQLYLWQPGAAEVQQQQLVLGARGGRQGLTRMAFDASGRRVAVGLTGLDNGRGALLLWERNGQGQTPLPGDEAPAALASSPDGRWLAAGTTTVVLRQWADPLRTTWEHEVGQQVESMQFSPDGQHLALGLGNGRTELWSVQDGRPLRMEFAHDADGRDDDSQRIVGVAFDPPGHWLATSDRGGDVWLWNVDPAQWVRRACALAGRALSASEWRAQRPGEPYDPICRPG